MDYKEKYEMALEGIQEILGSGEDSIKMSRLQLRLQGIFPELKESEDEKIRKVIADIVKAQPSDSLFNGTKEKCLAWLEKQGKQKSLDEIAKEVTNIAKEVTKDKDAAVSFLKSTGIINENGELADEYKIEQDEQNYQEKVVDNLHNYLYGEQKPTWSEEDENRFRNLIYLVEHSNEGKGTKEGFIKFINRLKSLKDRVQPKQEWSEEDRRILDEVIYMSENHLQLNAWDISWLKFLKNRCLPQPRREWSEEDEQMLQDIIRGLKSIEHLIFTHDSQGKTQIQSRIDWLKSLKDRVQTKPKQEWSEEDERMLNGIIHDLEYPGVNYYKKPIEEKVMWLKSLRPQNKWKPSKEQMEAFKNAIHIKPYENPSDSLLWGLYEQLKKLREE